MAQHFGFDPCCLTDGLAEGSRKQITDMLGKFSYNLIFITYRYRTVFTSVVKEQEIPFFFIK
jgi:hypothetical protein